MKDKNIFIDIEGEDLKSYEGGDIEITPAFIRFKTNDGKDIFIPWHRIRSIEITDKTESSEGKT